MTWATVSRCCVGWARRQQAEELLGNIVTGEHSSDREKSEALVERARVRAMLGRFDEARTDAEQSVALAGNNLALKTQRQNDIARLVEGHSRLRRTT